MILKRFYDEKLAQASYLIGCARTGEACVIDPSRNLEQYLDVAETEGLRIRHVTETHIHADYLSGSRELANHAGARLYLSDEGDADWKYAFADDENVRLLKDGDEIRVGNVVLKVWHTPGHTPEHISFLLTDTPASSAPQSLFSGDFLFVGDVGRPDLLERVANFAGTMEAGARRLYQSLQKLAELPDHVMVWPAHGAGSACGKSLGGVPVSTLGYERLQNWALQPMTEDNFVEMVLAGQPEPPFYFKEMKRMNKQGPSPRPAMAPHLGAERLSQMLRTHTILDMRPSAEAGKCLLPGAINVPAGKSFPTWAGWFVEYGTPVALIAPSEADAIQAIRDLASIGIDTVEGWFMPAALETFESSALGQYGSVTPQEIPADALVLDVRGAIEVAEGRIPGSTHIPLGHLKREAHSLPKDQTILIHCASGYRSAIGASILVAEGFTNVLNLTGGYNRWAHEVRQPSFA